MGISKIILTLLLVLNILFISADKKGFNITLGLSYRRLSPAHGTAKDIMFKQKSDNTSYLSCMLN